MPGRIQRKRTKGWQMPEGAVYVGRPSKWGNPWAFDDIAFVFGPPPDNDWWSCATVEQARAFVLKLYREWLEPRKIEARTKLAGKDLVCWCSLDVSCHADVLLEVANAGGS